MIIRIILCDKEHPDLDIIRDYDGYSFLEKKPEDVGREMIDMAEAFMKKNGEIKF